MSPLFCRWPVGYLSKSNGVCPWIKESPPIWMPPQRKYKFPTVSLKLSNKIRKMVNRGYIKEGVILNMTSFFSVPKLTEDIRMVFYVTVSGLNKYLRFPNFMSPSICSLLMMMGPQTHMVDLDSGEIFTTFGSTRCWQIIIEWVWYLIWGTRSNIKEQLY